MTNPTLGVRMKKVLVWAMVMLALANPLWGGEKILRLATTTSTDNTGLLDYLAPKFREDTGIILQWIAVGTGKALRLGQNCDVDVLLVHAPQAEEKFMRAGYGINRKAVMYNDFIIVGPPEDPAHIKCLPAREAFRQIAQKGALFISRGDDSGTNKKELALWRETGFTFQMLDRKPWYLQTGRGMLATLLMAAEKKAYTLTDRGTYIRFQAESENKSSLVVLVEGDKRLRNQYSVIMVNPAHCPDIRVEYAKLFINWITSDKGQQYIAHYKIQGKRLFIPNAKP